MLRKVTAALAAAASAVLLWASPAPAAYSSAHIPYANNVAVGTAAYLQSVGWGVAGGPAGTMQPVSAAWCTANMNCMLWYTRITWSNGGVRYWRDIVTIDRENNGSVDTWQTAGDHQIHRL